MCVSEQKCQFYHRYKLVRHYAIGDLDDEESNFFNE
jgi:hypothetical protein